MQRLTIEKWLLAMLGVTNTKLNQDVKDDVANGNASPSFVAKLGYDKQINSDLRFRITGSLYNTAWATRTYLYAGDRAGGYYLVMAPPTTNGATTTGATAFYNWSLQSLTSIIN